MSLAQRLFATLLATASLPALASSECPFIRPPGLSEEEVSALVTNIYAQALQRSAEGLDHSKTIKALDGTENAILTYSFASSEVGETLGFDAIRTFYDAAVVRGGDQPFDTLTLSELQALARAAYSSGADSLPPDAEEDKSYKVHSVIVRAPSPATGWRVVQCGGDKVTFQRVDQKSQSTAGVRIASLPPFDSDAAFLNSVSALLPSVIPSGYDIQPWRPTRAKTEARCADGTLVGKAASGAIFLRARICYENLRANFGSATLFMQVSQQLDEAPVVEAEEFVTGASPK